MVRWHYGKTFLTKIFDEFTLAILKALKVVWNQVFWTIALYLFTVKGACTFFLVLGVISHKLGPPTPFQQRAKKYISFFLINFGAIFFFKFVKYEEKKYFFVDGRLPSSPSRGRSHFRVSYRCLYQNTKFNVIASHFILIICMYFHFEHSYREILLQCPLRFEELHFLAPKVPYRPYRLLFLASISSNTIQQLLQTVCI